MALTEKGKNAFLQIKKFFPKGQFTAKELSDACGEKIVAATLNGVVNNGYLTKIEGTSPIVYEAIEDIDSIVIDDDKKGCDNSNLHSAKRVKNDEFYTRYEDIETEVMKYRKYFRGKVIYLPCDDPAEKKSEFWSFFINNFDAFGLKKLIATHYDEFGKAYKIWVENDLNRDGYIDDDDVLQEDLEGNGDFRSPECIDILKESDIVITNPPFSLFREFIHTIVNNNKYFLVIGNQNAFGYKEIFPLLKDNIIWTGYNMVKKFYQPDGSIKEFGNVCWFTNLPTSKRNDKMILTKVYNPYDYPKYDNYDAINVNRIIDIPKDYSGIMGVPITFLDKFSPNQFTIVGMSASWDESDEMKKIKTSAKRRHGPFIDGKEKYKRVFVKYN